MGFNYDSIIGTLLLGIFFNTFLYGLVTYQFAAYYRTKFNDRSMIKFMVLFLFILDTVHSASVIYLAWDYTVANYGNPAALVVGVWPYQFTPIATALSAFVTQLYLGFSNKILYGIVIILAAPALILGVTCSIEAWMITAFSELHRITPLVIAWLTMQFIVDIYITITLIVAFSRSRTGFRKTDTILNKFIRGAIQTGVFAGVFSLGVLITFIILPNTNLYGMFAIPIGRIYTNTLLDSLLTRRLLKDGVTDTYNMRGMIRSLGRPPDDSLRTASTPHATNIQVNVQQTVHETGDNMSCNDSNDKVIPLAV